MTAPFWAAEHWCQEESGKVRHSFEAVVLVCAVLMLPAVLIQESGLHSPWLRRRHARHCRLARVHGRARAHAVSRATVGYGDTFPTSVVGRLVASFLMVVGIGFLGLATASIRGPFREPGRRGQAPRVDRQAGRDPR
jgi:hypothetical protein